APAPSPQRGQDSGRLDPQSRTGPGRDHHRLRHGAGAHDRDRRGRCGDGGRAHRGRGDGPGRPRAEANEGPEPVTSAVSTAAARTSSGPGPRGAHRALLPLGIAAAGIALALILQVVFDPFRTDIPLCLVYHLTGLYCPGCGSRRAVHAPLDGDLRLALRNNSFSVFAAPLVAVGFVVWTVQRVRCRPSELRPLQRVVMPLFVLVTAYTVARTLPALWFIAPTALVGA